MKNHNSLMNAYSRCTQSQIVTSVQAFWVAKTPQFQHNMGFGQAISDRMFRTRDKSGTTTICRPLLLTMSLLNSKLFGLRGSWGYYHLKYFGVFIRS